MVWHSLFLQCSAAPDSLLQKSAGGGSREIPRVPKSPFGFSYKSYSLTNCPGCGNHSNINSNHAQKYLPNSLHLPYELVPIFHLYTIGLYTGPLMAMLLQKLIYYNGSSTPRPFGSPYRWDLYIILYVTIVIFLQYSVIWKLYIIIETTIYKPRWMQYLWTILTVMWLVLIVLQMILAQLKIINVVWIIQILSVNNVLVLIANITFKESAEDGVHNTLDIPIVHATTKIYVPENSADTATNYNIITNLDQMENSSNISGLNDETIEAGNTAKGNLDHQRHESTKYDITSIPKILSKEISSVNLGKSYLNSLRCKLSIMFGICCIIGCYIMPIILFYASRTSNNPEMHYEYLNRKNTSSSKVLYML